MAKAKILVVEDERIITMDMKNRLQNLGYDVPAIASSGEEAVKKAEEINPDLVLMDIMLKGAMSSIEAAERIRSSSNTPIIYHSDEAMFQQAKMTEPYGYILKPFNERELHLTIEMAIYRHKMEEALRLSAKVFENAMDRIMITDERGIILAINNAFTKMTGYTPEEAIGKNPRLLKSGRQDTEFYKDFWDTLIAKGKWEGEIWNRRKNGEIYPEWAVISVIKDNRGNTTHYIDVMRDINDTFGHDAGDILLQSIMKRLINCIRQGDTVASIGGDEFTIILPNVTQKEEVDEIAQRLSDTLKESYLINKHKLYVTASVGISFYPDDGEDIQTLMKKADIAMYRAKEKGKNNYQFYAG